jgi:hypothetical protein
MNGISSQVRSSTTRLLPLYTRTPSTVDFQTLCKRIITNTSFYCHHSNKMAAKIKNKSKTEKPPAIDKLLKPAVGVVLAFVAYYFMKGINTDVSYK